MPQDALDVRRILEGASGGTDNFMPPHTEALEPRAVLGSVTPEYTQQLHFCTSVPLEGNVFEDGQVIRAPSSDTFTPAIPVDPLCRKLRPNWPVDREHARPR